MSSVASSVQPKRELSPFALAACAACMSERLHTDDEWKNHPMARHGYSKETGWTSPVAEKLHLAELESANAKRAASNRTPEAN